MEFTPLWKVEIAKVNLLDRVNNEALIEEVHLLHCLCPRESDRALALTKEQFPALVAFRDDILLPQAHAYIRNVFGVVPSDITVDTFGKVFGDKEGLGHHLHGNSMLTTVYYPEDSSAGMTLFDPRFNASRGYPRSIRDGHFGDHYITPKAGDLWIMPSYLQHNVEPNKQDMRISLINDFHFRA